MTCDFKSATKLFPIPENPPGPLPELGKPLTYEVDALRALMISGVASSGL
jgi:hypothetical protein